MITPDDLKKLDELTSAVRALADTAPYLFEAPPFEDGQRSGAYRGDVPENVMRATTEFGFAIWNLESRLRVLRHAVKVAADQG